MKNIYYLFLFCFMVIFLACGDSPAVKNVECGTGTNIGAAGGTGGTGEEVTVTSSGGSGGGGGWTEGDGGSGAATYKEDLFDSNNCTQTILTVFKMHDQTLAVGTFHPPVNTEINTFYYSTILDDNHTPPCSDLNHQIVFFLSPTQIPSDFPDNMIQISQLRRQGEINEVELTPHLVTTENLPYIIIGVRLVAGLSDSLCLKGCRPTINPERNLVNFQKIPPYQWQLLTQVNDLQIGKKADYFFTISGILHN